MPICDVAIFDPQHSLCIVDLRQRRSTMTIQDCTFKLKASMDVYSFDVSMAFRYSRLRRAMWETEIAAGQAASHS